MCVLTVSLSILCTYDLPHAEQEHCCCGVSHSYMHCSLYCLGASKCVWSMTWQNLLLGTSHLRMASAKKRNSNWKKCVLCMYIHIRTVEHNSEATSMMGPHTAQSNEFLYHIVLRTYPLNKITPIWYWPISYRLVGQCSSILVSAVLLLI